MKKVYSVRLYYWDDDSYLTSVTVGIFDSEKKAEEVYIRLLIDSKNIKGFEEVCIFSIDAPETDEEIEEVLSDILSKFKKETKDET
jgi:hypothetical protein